MPQKIVYVFPVGHILRSNIWVGVLSSWWRRTAPTSAPTISPTMTSPCMQRTTREHFHPSVSESTEVSAVPSEMVDAKTSVEVEFFFVLLRQKRCLPLAERSRCVVAELHLLALCAEIIVLTKNMRFLKVSRLKAPSRVDTISIELQGSVTPCRRRWNVSWRTPCLRPTSSLRQRVISTSALWTR